MTTNADTPLNFFNCDALCKIEVTESDKFTFGWSISRFSLRVKEKVNGEYLKSKGFQILGPGSRVTNFHLKLYPNGETPSVKDFTSLFLYTEDTQDVVLAKCSLMVVVSPNVFKKREYDMEKIHPDRGFGWTKFCHGGNKLAKFTQNDIKNLLNLWSVASRMKLYRRITIKTSFHKIFFIFIAPRNLQISRLNVEANHINVTKTFWLLDLLCSMQCSNQI